MKDKTLKELAQSLDSNYGSLGLNQATINNVSTELGRVSEVIDNTNETDLTVLALTMNDIKHSIQLLADLLTYTTNDLSINLEETGEIKEAIFNKTVSSPGGDK